MVERFRPPLSPSLGQSLSAARQQLDWSFKRMAMAVGVPYEAYLSLESDAALPTFDQLPAIRDMVATTALQLERMVRETARIILRHTLDCASKTPRAVAARRRGVKRADADQALWANLPAPLRRVTAEDLNVDENDAAGVAEALRKLAAASDDAREATIEGIVVALELEGEAEVLAQMPWSELLSDVEEGE